MRTNLAKSHINRGDDFFFFFGVMVNFLWELTTMVNYCYKNISIIYRKIDSIYGNPANINKNLAIIYGNSASIYGNPLAFMELCLHLLNSASIYGTPLAFMGTLLAFMEISQTLMRSPLVFMETLIVFMELRYFISYFLGSKSHLIF